MIVLSLSHLLVTPEFRPEAVVGEGAVGLSLCTGPRGALDRCTYAVSQRR